MKDTIICDTCGNGFNTNFCPNCARSYDIAKAVIDAKPIVISIHGASSNNTRLLEANGIDLNSALGRKLTKIDSIMNFKYDVKGDGKMPTEIDLGYGYFKIVPLD